MSKASSTISIISSKFYRLIAPAFMIVLATSVGLGYYIVSNEQPSGAQAASLDYLENFASTTYKDDAKTTAVWESGNAHIANIADMFVSAGTVSVGLSPVPLVSADFNNDGKRDIVDGNSGSNTISVLLGNGDGTFQSKVDYPTGSNPRAIVSGDFNGDKRLDVVVVNNTSSTVSALLGNGNGTFQPKVDYATGSSPYAVVAGDFNADSKLDIAVVNYNSNTLSVLLGNGNGTFQPKVDYATNTLPHGVASADINGDGKLDLISANQFGNISVFIGNGNGTFKTKVDYVTVSGSYALAIGNFNGDQILDVAVANGVSNNVSILIGNGDGTFKSKVDYGAGGLPLFVVADDVTGDAIADLVVVNNSSANISVLQGNGDGTFKAKVDYTTSQNPNAVTIADFNGDGKKDLAVTNNTANSILILTPKTTYFAAPNTTGSGQLVSSKLNMDTTQQGDVSSVILTPTVSVPVGTRVEYKVSRDGGITWCLLPEYSTSSHTFVTSAFDFTQVNGCNTAASLSVAANMVTAPTGNDLRYRLELSTTAANATPSVMSLRIAGTFDALGSSGNTDSAANINTVSGSGNGRSGVLGCNYLEKNTRHPSGVNALNANGDCDYSQNPTTTVRLGQEFRTTLMVDGFEGATETSCKTDAANVQKTRAYLFTSATETDPTKSIGQYQALSRCEFLNGTRYAWFRLLVGNSAQSNTVLPSGGFYTWQSVPVNFSGDVYVRLLRDGNMSNVLKVVTVSAVPGVSPILGEPGPKIAPTGSFIAGQTITATVDPGLPDPKASIKTARAQIRASDQDATNAVVSVSVGETSSISVTVPATITTTGTYKLCYVVDAVTGDGQPLTEAEACRDIQVTPFSFSLNASPTSLNFGDLVTLSWSIPTSSGLSSNLVLPANDALSVVGPVSSCTNLDAAPSVPIPGRPTATELTGKQIQIPGPMYAGGSSYLYAYRLTLLLNGVPVSATSTNCVSFRLGDFSASIIDAAGGKSVRPGQQFWITFAAAPISAGDVLSGTVLRNGVNDISISDADVRAGKVIVTAPAKQGSYTYALKLSDKTTAKTTTVTTTAKTVTVAGESVAGTDQVLVPVVYVLSYNDTANTSTIEVFKKITSQISFFTNIPNVTEEVVSSYRRDFQRFTDLLGFSKTLDSYFVRNNSYPGLQSGTFIPGFSISLWPSWKTTLGALLDAIPVDPVNQFGNQQRYKASLTVKPTMDTVDPSKNPTVVTTDGRTAGVNTVWQSAFPVVPGDVQALAIDAAGRASGWVRKVGAGAVIRLFDVNKFPDSGKPERTTWIDTICAVTAKYGSGIDCGKTQNDSPSIAIEQSVSTGTKGSASHRITLLDTAIKQGSTIAYDVWTAQSSVPGLSSTNAVISGEPNSALSTWVERRMTVPADTKTLYVVEKGGVATEVINRYRNIRLVTLDPNTGSYTTAQQIWGGTDINGDKGLLSSSDKQVVRVVNPDLTKNVQVYYDPRYAGAYANIGSTGVDGMSDAFGVALSSKLAVRGAGTLDANDLVKFMSDGQKGGGTVVVFANDAIPRTVLDPDRPGYRSILRQYIDRGGVVLFIGQTPGGLVATSATAVMDMSQRYVGAAYEFMADFVPDPCPNHDPATCWSQDTKDFACPYGSSVYAYRALSSDKYQLAANFENPSIRWGLPLLEETWPNTSVSKVENYVAECTDPSSAQAMRSGVYNGSMSCGDGMIQPPNETCELGDVRNACAARAYYRTASGAYAPIPPKYRGKTAWHGTSPQQCNACNYSVVEQADGTPAIPSLDDLCGGFCGDGITQPASESCDGSFEPSVSGMRCSDGSMPSCSASCSAVCTSSVVSCYSANGAESPVSTITVSGLVANSVYGFTILNANGTMPVRSIGTMKASGASVSIGPVATMNVANSACGYQLAVQCPGGAQHIVPVTGMKATVSCQ